MSNQKRRLHRVAFPPFLAPEVVPFASVEHVHPDGTVDAVQAPRYTVQVRHGFWAVLDADGHRFGLPNVFETFTTAARAASCAATLNASVWGYRKRAPLVAPARHRDVTPDMRDDRCVCGVRVTRHYDGWDGNRLSCDEAIRRHGVA